MLVILTTVLFGTFTSLVGKCLLPEQISEEEKTLNL